MYHNIIIAGNLGRDPELRYTPTGQAVTNFSVATNRQYTNSAGEVVKETTWFRVTTWGKTAENCNQYLHKGSKVLVEGRLNSDQATGGPKVFQRLDGTSGAAYEVTAQMVRFLDGASSAAGQNGQEEALSEEGASAEDIPF